MNPRRWIQQSRRRAGRHRRRPKPVYILTIPPGDGSAEQAAALHRTADEISEAWQAQPFRPLLLNLPEGAKFKRVR